MHTAATQDYIYGLNFEAHFPRNEVLFIETMSFINVKTSDKKNVHPIFNNKTYLL